MSYMFYLCCGRRLDFSQDYRNVHPNISVRAFPLSHGETETGVYESSAFLFRHDISGSEFVLCGDLEPDKCVPVPPKAQSYN